MLISKQLLRRKAVKTAYRLGLVKGSYNSPQILSEQIINAIHEEKPFALGRLGVSELNGFCAYNGDKHPDWVKINYKSTRKGMSVNAGIYPDDEEYYRAWGESYRSVIQEMDMFAVYYNFIELYILRYYLDKCVALGNSTIVHAMLDNVSWLSACSGKKILIVTSNVKTIEKQLTIKEKIFEHVKFSLPDADYNLLRSPFSPLVDPSNTSLSSEEELIKMRGYIDDYDPEIVLAAAGGYSNQLVSYAKKIGKVGINMGGSIDPLFGIKTKRYVTQNNRVPKSFINEHWIEPLAEDKPAGADSIEGGCYW